ncbi:nucleotidyltransferase family protein [Intrasporangium chromatireducens]|uniref:nucleotidyltransferase family protein n=1 Tax=Intrasporangium chromatireducens TaxID=1386088 RepID=UPI001F0B11F1|nr:nucleotidyltransferase family protein [Intrasporangium chromatireducens]
MVPRDLAGAARCHGVSGWVRKRARSTGWRVDGVEDDVRATSARHQRAMWDLGVIDGALGSANVPYIVVKGPVLAEAYHDHPQLRSYLDLDVVVRPTDLRGAILALEAKGLDVLDVNWPLLQRQGVHELRLSTPTGGLLDLHWSLLPGIHNGRSPDVETLLERADWLRLGDLLVAVLDWADTAVHVASHAAASGGDRLIWCADLLAEAARVSRRIDSDQEGCGTWESTTRPRRRTGRCG